MRSEYAKDLTESSFLKWKDFFTSCKGIYPEEVQNTKTKHQLPLYEIFGHINELIINKSHFDYNDPNKNHVKYGSHNQYQYTLLVI